MISHKNINTLYHKKFYFQYTRSRVQGLMSTPLDYINNVFYLSICWLNIMHMH